MGKEMAHIFSFFSGTAFKMIRKYALAWEEETLSKSEIVVKVVFAFEQALSLGWFKLKNRSVRPSVLCEEIAKKSSSVPPPENLYSHK